MKKKMEQLFILVVASIGMLGLLCLSGCGGGSCEGIQCGNVSEDGVTAMGVSLPGCGGCASSEKGCNSVCYPQSVKVFGGLVQEDMGTVEDPTDITKSFYLGCDNRYYGDGCLGCGQAEKSCYSTLFVQDIENVGVFYGSSDGEEKFCGVINGCGGCVASDELGKDAVTLFEQGLGID